MAVVLCGNSGMRAYDTTDLINDNWALVNNLENNSDYVYVFIDAKSSAYAMADDNTSNPWESWSTPSYRTLSAPAATPTMVWTMETRSDGYALRNMETGRYFNSNNGGSGEGWLDKMADTYDTGSFTLTLSDGKYDILGVSSGLYVGPWNNDGFVKTAGENIAANKSLEQAPGFYVYRMSKANYAAVYLSNCPHLTSPVNLTFLLTNPTIYQGGTATSLPAGWENYDSHTTDDNKYTEGTGNTKLRGYRSSSSIYNHTLDFDYYTTVNNVPGGSWTLTTSASCNRNTAYAYIYNATTSQKTSTALTSTEEDVRVNTTVTHRESITVGIEANITIGNSLSTKTALVNADNFRLSIDPYVSIMAVALPEDGTMKAGIWYSFTTPATCDHDFSRTTSIGEIIYTTGTQTTLSEATSAGLSFSATQHLIAGETYYIRSNTDNRFVIDRTPKNIYFDDGVLNSSIPYIRTYEKDIKDGDVSGMQDVPWWTISSNGDARAAGVVEIGGSTQLGGEGGVIPTSKYDKLSNGKVLAIEAVWNQTAQYRQYVTLPAGTKTIAIPIYNSKGAAAIETNLFGFAEDGGTTHYATTTQYPVGSWTLETVTFDTALASETSGYLSLGYTAANTGDANMPHLFVDRVIIADASASLAINSTAKWGTFCAPFDVAVPDGVTAYTISDVENNMVVKTEVENSVIPANTPVMVNAESGLSNTTFYGVKVANDDPVYGDNDLVQYGLLIGNLNNSATKTVTGDDNNYLLQIHDGKTGFYKMTDETNYTLGKNRCYLQLEEGGGSARAALFLNEEDAETAISVLQALDEKQQLKDGKYLVGGKIVVVKEGRRYSLNGILK